MHHHAPVFRPGVPGLIPDTWIVNPGQTSSAPPLVAVHGITRNTDEVVSHLRLRAQETGCTLVVPLFDKAHWPRYQRAACTHRADWALLRLMTALRAEGSISEQPFVLSGFSGGAQFAHRFAWLYPELVGRLCLTAPGWWTLPDPQTAWPYGIGTAPDDQGQGFRLRANLRRFLDRPIAICVGDEDVERDRNLRKGTAIDAAQGGTRLERAQNWYTQIEAASRAIGLTPQVSLHILPNCGHSFVDCVLRGGIDTHYIPPAEGCSVSKNTQKCSTPRHTNQISTRKAA